MGEQRLYPADPMAAFYAAVTAVENGKVGEVELDFHLNSESSQYNITMSVVVRREQKPQVLAIAPNYMKDEENKDE